MPTRRQFARNVMVNWMAMLAGMVVPFFLSPFLVHRLGNITYGIWVLVISSVSYFQLLDMGLRSAIVRFVSRSHTQGQHDESRRIVATALWLRLGIGLLVVLCAAMLAGIFPHLFKIPIGLQRPAQWAILITSLGIAGTLTSGVPGAVLSAIHRFDLLSSMNILRVVLRASGAMWVLHAGYGIVALALCELAATVVSGIGMSWMCLITYPELRTFFGRADREVMSKIWGYSIYVFIATVAGAVVYHTDNIVVGIFFSASTVTFYALAGNLVLYSREVVTALSTTFIPLASGYEAEGQIERLQDLLIKGTRASLMLSLPVTIALFFRGQTFLSLWVGLEYAGVSGMVMKILLVNQVMQLGNVTAAGMSYGLGKHRPVAIWAMCEAVLNLVLSVLLIRPLGVYGVAWGTVIPGVVIHLVCWPRYITKFLGVPALSYLMKGWGMVGVAAIPFAMACYWEEQHLVASNLAIFFLQVLAITPIFILPSLMLMWRDVTPLFRRQFARA